jgi:hypothetical protein
LEKWKGNNMRTYLFVNSEQGINLTIQAMHEDDAFDKFNRCFFENDHEWTIFREMKEKDFGRAHG